MFILAGLLIFFVHLQPARSYTLQEITKDSQSIDFDSLVKYRGPILTDVWLKNNSHHREIETCRVLFNQALQTVTATWPPPKVPPPHLKDDYLMGGRSELLHLYLAERQNGGDGYNWNTKVMQNFRSKPNVCGGYKQSHCDIVMKKHQNYIENKVGIVVGSQSPWAEAALFNLNAMSIITIEYMNIKSDYPNYKGIHPSKVAESYLEKQWELVDFAFSFSSLEHDGLGRYGDPINPFADLESLARIRCLLKPNGILFLGVPVSLDAVAWNAHRMYGKYRLNLFLLGWHILDIYPEDCSIAEESKGNYECTPIIILKKSAHHNNN